MSKIKSPTFAILNIHELSFYFKDPAFGSSVNLDKIVLEGKYDLNYKWSIQQEMFAIQFDFAYLLPEDKSNKDAFLKLSTLTEFHVKDLKNVLTVRTNNDFDIDERLEITLVSIAISTCRGIIFEKTKGTIFNKFILPLMNTQEMILSKRLKEESKSKK